jgi:hypothetical protein
VRTTLTLDPDVVRLITDEVHRSRQPFKRVVNDALRRGFAPAGPVRSATPYRVKPHIATLVAGLDRHRFNALVDELEDAATIQKLTRVPRATRAAERRR